MVGAEAPDASGDARLLELAKAGIGHATVIRTGAIGLEAADLDLALRYLPDVHAIILVAPDPSLVAPAAAASGWSGAGLVIAAEHGDELDTSVAPEAIVLEPPPRDADGTFAGLLAGLAMRLDAGDDPKAAWQSTVATLAVDPVGD